MFFSMLLRCLHVGPKALIERVWLCCNVNILQVDIDVGSTSWIRIIVEQL